MLDMAFFNQMDDILSEQGKSVEQQLRRLNVLLWQYGEQFMVMQDDGAPGKVIFLHRLNVAAPAFRGDKDNVLTRKGLLQVSKKMTLCRHVLQQIYQFQQEAINEKMEERRHGQVGCIHENRSDIQVYLSHQLELAEYLSKLDEKQRNKQGTQHE